ncbi:MAG TPA: hypothetical protein VH877_21230 [Polyangia bacterium]|jgi:hypothetical protein|nr:hypothetical protein [Polyangia bacterium]
MAENVTLEDLARAEAASLRERTRAKLSYEEAQRQLAIEVPQRFFELASGAREGVSRFNAALREETEPRPTAAHYQESVGVTTRSTNLSTDFNFEVRRAPHWMQLFMRSMWRPGKSDSVIIEGQGSVGFKPEEKRFQLRIDGVVNAQGELSYRALCDGQIVDTPIAELGERIVMVVVTGQLSRLWIKPPWTEGR